MDSGSPSAEAAPPPVLTDLADGVLTITLNRPDKLNAMDLPLLRGMVAALDRADADDDVRVVIVTGAGRAFCAGADLSAGIDTFDYDKVADGPARVAEDEATTGTGRLVDGPARVNGELRDGGGILALRIFRCTKPVIAAVNGPAVGVGATMTLPMDIRLAADGARFGFVFAARGIVPEACSSWFLPRIVGISTALEWCYRADLIPAADAHAGGLVRSVHPPDELLPAARELALAIAASAPVSVSLTRMMLWRMLGEPHPMMAHRIESRGVNHLGRSADAREGVGAFFERRTPEWSLSVPADLPAFVPWWDDPVFE